MRITISYLKNIIEEELMKMLDEQRRGPEGEQKAVTTSKKTRIGRSGKKKTWETQPVIVKGEKKPVQMPTTGVTSIDRQKEWYPGTIEKVHGTRKPPESLADVITSRGGTRKDIAQSADVWHGNEPTRRGDWPGEKKTLDLPPRLRSKKTADEPATEPEPD
jgi:hypothetical protein